MLSLRQPGRSLLARSLAHALTLALLAGMTPATTEAWLRVRSTPSNWLIQSDAALQTSSNDGRCRNIAAAFLRVRLRRDGWWVGGCFS
jgi:hypothetical protein